MRPIAHVRDSEIRALVCESLRVCPSGPQAQQWLTERGFLKKLEELNTNNAAALLELESSKKPVVAILNHVALIHYGLLVGVPASIMDQLLLAVESPLAHRFFPQAGIWRQYALAIVAFVRCQSFAAGPIKPKGYEKFFVPYIS